MTATNSVLPVGLRKVRVFELDPSGNFKATGSTPYEGLSFQGPKAYSLNIPESRRIAHLGNDRLIATDQLPSLEPYAGEIRVSAVDYDLDAFLMGQSTFGLGSALAVARGTDLQGSERQVAMLLYQQALVRSTKSRVWRFHLIPMTRAIPIPSSFTENAEDHRYSLAPTPVSKLPWGESLKVPTHGVTEATIFDGFMVNKPHIAAWLGDGTSTDFNFHVDRPAAESTEAYGVWVNGVSATVTRSTTGIEFSSPPANGALIVAFYGVANDPD
jgi:hypothetical protein